MILKENGRSNPRAWPTEYAKESVATVTDLICLHFIFSQCETVVAVEVP